ncbi:MAG: C1 family peptidase [Oligoflexia bacterium]|nr:C1 family peptidase [Oligoflexia bacterium]
MKILFLLLFLATTTSTPTLFANSRADFLTPEEIKQRILHPELNANSAANQNQQHTLESRHNMEIKSIEDLLGKDVVAEIRAKKAAALKSTLSHPPLLFENKSVDLRFRDTPVKDQSLFVGSIWGFPVGTCTAFGLAAVMENLIGNPHEGHLSERHLWSHYGQINMFNAIDAATIQYTTEENYWPEENKNPRSGYLDHAHTKIRAGKKLGNDLQAMVDYLNRGRPLYMGFATPRDVGDCKAVAASLENTGGSHAVAVVGYQADNEIPGAGYFIIKNSWGEKCGDHGYHYVPFQYCQEIKNDCYFYGLDEVETAFPLPEGSGEVGNFQIDEVTLKVKAYRKWYSTFRDITLYLESPSDEKRAIASVTYTLSDSILKPGLAENSGNNFKWGFRTKKRNYTITIQIRLFDGRNFEQKRTISF